MKKEIVLPKKFNTVENELRIKYPSLGYKVDYKRSRSAAIKLMCISCMGGSIAQVKQCKSTTCPLWSYRPGNNKIRSKTVPNEQFYVKAMELSNRGKYFKEKAENE